MLARFNLEILRLLVKSNPMSTANTTASTMPITIPIFAPFERFIRRDETGEVEDDVGDDVGDEVGYGNLMFMGVVAIIVDVGEPLGSGNADIIIWMFSYFSPVLELVSYILKRYSELHRVVVLVIIKRADRSNVP